MVIIFNENEGKWVLAIIWHAHIKFINYDILLEKELEPEITTLLGCTG